MPIHRIHVGHYAMGGERATRVEQHPQEKVKKDVPVGCEDLDDLCPEWATSGECGRNPGYMVGSRARPGRCIQACKRCDVVLDTGAEHTQDQAREEGKKQQQQQGERRL